MKIDNLLIKAHVNGGKLEKFADSCASMARFLWVGRSVEVIPSPLGMNTYTLEVKEDRPSRASSWIEAASFTFTIYPIGPLINLIMMVAYAIIAVPAALTRAIGLAAKKIALATDKDAHTYNLIVQKFLNIDQQGKKLEQLSKKLSLRNNAIEALQNKINNLNSIKISANENCHYTPVLMHKVKCEKDVLETALKMTQKTVSDLEQEINSTEPEFIRLVEEYGSIAGQLSSHANISIKLPQTFEERYFKLAQAD